MVTKTNKTKVGLPALLGVLGQESAGGKTTLTTAIADVLTMAGHPYLPFQADDKPRLQQMLGARVVNLGADPELLLRQPSLLRTAYTPLYSACEQAHKTGTSVLLDGGAREIENLGGFFTDVEIDEDLVRWKLPMLVFVPMQSDPESISGAAFTWRRLRESVPSVQLVLVENLHDRGAIERLSITSPARRLFDAELAPLLVGAPRLVMPAMITEFWQPFEESGTRFLKILALDAEEGAALFEMSTGDFKLARGNVTKFFTRVRTQLLDLLAFPVKEEPNA